MATHRWLGRGGVRSGTRSLVLGVAAAATVAGLAACSPSGSGSSSGGASSAPLSTLVVARTGDIDKLDPQLATAFQTVQTLNLVYSTLVKTDVNGQIVPDL